MQRSTAISVEDLNNMVIQHGYGCHYVEPDGEGGGNEYELWSNEHAKGVTGVYDTLDELANDVACVVLGGHPL